MKQLLNGSRFGYHNNGMVYAKGDFLNWYNSDLDCLEDKQNSPCPVQFINVLMYDIDENGIWLELPKYWEDNDTWHICEKSLNAGCFNFINNKILKNELK